MIEYMVLRYGLNYMPASLNIIAKRIGISESDKNLDILKNELEKLVRKHKAYKSGNRFAIDTEGARAISQVCMKKEASGKYPTPENFRKTFRQMLANR